jgi:caffeoyl-CoA O-methyltransferase
MLGSAAQTKCAREFNNLARPRSARSSSAPPRREPDGGHRIKLKIQPALQTLDELAAAENGRRGFDFAFVDADKPNYFAYFEKLLTLIRPGGLIAVDNTLGLSRTPVIRMTSENAQAIKEFNRRVHHDPRVEIAMLPVGEGLTLLRVVR